MNVWPIWCNAKVIGDAFLARIMHRAAA